MGFATDCIIESLLAISNEVNDSGLGKKPPDRSAFSNHKGFEVRSDINIKGSNSNSISSNIQQTKYCTMTESIGKNRKSQITMKIQQTKIPDSGTFEYLSQCKVLDILSPSTSTQEHDPYCELKIITNHKLHIVKGASLQQSNHDRSKSSRVIEDVSKIKIQEIQSLRADGPPVNWDTFGDADLDILLSTQSFSTIGIIAARQHISGEDEVDVTKKFFTSIEQSNILPDCIKELKIVMRSRRLAQAIKATTQCHKIRVRKRKRSGENSKRSRIEKPIGVETSKSFTDKNVTGIGEAE